MPDGRLQGRPAVVTGAGSGIGRAIAERFAREGAPVLLADRDAPRGRDAAAGIAASGGRAEFLQVDVTDAGDCRRLAGEAVRLWGGLEILVNSAGVGEGGPVAEFEEEAWDRVLDANLKGVYLCCRAALPALSRQGGAIVNIASLAGLAARPGMGAYAASKAGVIQLTRVLALEGAPQRVRANAICPVWIDTPMFQRFLERSGRPDRTRRHLEAGVPLGRIGTVEDVSNAALFLASDEAEFITGVALPVDGGALCR